MQMPGSLRRNVAGWRTTLAVLLCTALGMAATAAVVHLLDLTLRSHGDFPQVERIVRVWNTEVGADAREELAWADFDDLAAHVPAFASVEAAARARLVWHLPSGPARRVEGEAVSDGYFASLGVRPQLGRLFSADEMRRGDPVMLLSQAAWAREFGYADDILGRRVSTSNQAGERRDFTVIGVLPPAFGGTIEEDMPDLEYWLPAAAYLSPEQRQDRRLRSTWLLARLRDDATLAQAAEQVAALGQQRVGEFAAFDPQHRFVVERFGASWSAAYREAAPLLSAAAALLLGIAAFNVFLLLLSRTLERRNELAMRAALGASRRRLLLECATHGVALSVAGGVLGIALAPLLLAAILRMGELQLPEYLSGWPSPVSLLLSFAVLLLVAVLASVLPAWRVLRGDPAAAIAGGSRHLGHGAAASAWQRGLVVAQIGLATALLTGAGALGQAWLALDRSELGFATRDRLRMGLFVNADDVADSAALPAFIDRVDQQLKQQPGVRAIAWVWPTVPIVDAVPVPLGHPLLDDDGGAAGVIAGGYVVRPGFFSALQIPLLAGRDFSAADGPAAGRVAIVGASLAERLGGPARALQQTLRIGEDDVTIVGVAGDTRFGGAAERSSHAHELYLHFDQNPRRVVSPVLWLDGDPAAQAPAMTRALAAAAPASAIDWVEPVEQFAGWLIREQRFRFLVVGLISLSALLLAGAGLYGLMSQQVLRRTREIGLRKALGSRDSAILGSQLRAAAAMAIAGLASGWMLALGLGSLLQGRLPALADIAAPTLLTIAGTLLLVALVAAGAPALRAARISPMQALREQ